MKTRLYFLDHLRTFAIFLVVVVHAGIVYEPILERIWLVSDPIKNGSIGLLRMYLDLIVMFTIFFISGYFVADSVHNKPAINFLKSKVKRILWPWLLAVSTLIPAYKMIFLYSRGLPQEAWYSYFHIFQRPAADLASYANNPSQSWLWFLPILFTFQVLYLLFARLHLTPLRFSIRIAVLLTIVFGVISGMIISNAGLTGWYHSGFLEFQRERLIPYFLVFMLGAICNDQDILARPRNKRVLLIANILLSLAISIFTVVALNLFFNMVDPSRNYYFISDTFDRFVYYLTTLLTMLSLLYILLHFFRAYLDRPIPFLQILNKNSYSVYIIHLIVMGVIALPLTHWQIPAIPKFILLTTLTYLISNLLVSVYRLTVAKYHYMKMGLTAMVVIVFLTLTSQGQHNFPNRYQRDQSNYLQDSIAPRTDIHHAILKDDFDALNMHIQAGLNLNAREQKGGSTPLITAAVFGKIDAAKILIRNGADLNLTNHEGSTALLSAAFFGRIDIVELLLEHKADHRIKNNNGATALSAVAVPFEEVEDIYNYFQASLGPIGLQLDYQQLRKDRIIIADLLKRVE